MRLFINKKEVPFVEAALFIAYTKAIEKHEFDKSNVFARLLDRVKLCVELQENVKNSVESVEK